MDLAALTIPATIQTDPLPRLDPEQSMNYVLYPFPSGIRDDGGDHGSLGGGRGSRFGVDQPVFGDGCDLGSGARGHLVAASAPVLSLVRSHAPNAASIVGKTAGWPARAGAGHGQRGRRSAIVVA